MNQLSDALLIIDLQNGVCLTPDKSYRLDELVTQLNERIEKFNTENRTIIFVQHADAFLTENSIKFELLPELHRPSTSLYIRKTHANSFYHTNLQHILDLNQCQSIEIWGAQTEYCIDATTKFAHGLGYQLSMYHGGTTTYETSYMTAKQTVDFYESIWKDRFVTMINKKEE